jgi:hypothetical protein
VQLDFRRRERWRYLLKTKLLTFGCYGELILHFLRFQLGYCLVLFNFNQMGLSESGSKQPSQPRLALPERKFPCILVISPTGKFRHIPSELNAALGVPTILGECHQSCPRIPAQNLGQTPQGNLHQAGGIILLTSIVYMNLKYLP